MAPRVPRPELVAAWHALGRVPVERVPQWAAQWLCGGSDGSALRELAGLGAGEPRGVHDLLPDALAEMSVAIPDAVVAAAEVWFDELAERCLAGAVSERWVVDMVEQTVERTGHLPGPALTGGRVRGVSGV